MTFGSLFSGIGGFEYGLERAGWTIRWQVENDPFCQRVLERRWPGVARWGDVRTLWADEQSGWPRIAQAGDGQGALEELHGAAGRIDLLVGGFPCQDLSIAGKRAGLGGERSGLFWEIVRIAKILTPAWGLVENVPGLLSSNGGRDMGLVLAGLRECWPAVGYRVLDSRYFGVAQRRRRVFFVCGPDEARVAAVLFEPEGGGVDSAPGGEAGAGVAGCAALRAHKASEDDVNLVTVGAIPARYGKGTDSDADPMVVGALGCDKERGGWRAGPDEAMAGQIIVGQCHGSNVGPMGSLRKGDGGLTSGVPFVTRPLKAEGHDGSEDGTGRGGTARLAIQEVDGRRSKDPGIGIGGEVMYSLQAGHQHGVGTPVTVRRLTPTECTRLQAFPDGWCCLCQPLDVWADDPETAAERCTCADSPQYRAYGNAVTTTMAEWIGRRLLETIAP